MRISDWSSDVRSSDLTTIELVVEPAEEAGERAVPFALAGIVGLEDRGAQRRGEDQRDQYRKRHRRDDGDRELAIDDAGRSADEGHRQEHGRQTHADNDQRAADLVNRFSRRFLWRPMLLLPQAFDIFAEQDRKNARRGNI